MPSAVTAPSGFADVILPPLDRRDQLVSPAAMPTRVDPDVPAGHRRLWSETGGWTLDIPAEWTAETSHLRGAEVYSRQPTSGDRGSAMTPPADLVRLNVQLAYDPDGLDLDAFARRWAPNGSGPTRDRGALTLAGQPALTLRIDPNMPPGTSVPHRHWIVRSPHFRDRFLVVNAWPADGPHREVLERVAASLRLERPVSGPDRPMRERREVLEDATVKNGKPLPVARAEAKLVLYRDVERHLGGRSMLTDPDTPVWVVALGGDLSWYAQVMRRGPAGGAAGTPTPPKHVLLISDARLGIGFSFYASAADWPAWWDALRDRAP